VARTIQEARIFCKVPQFVYNVPALLFICVVLRSFARAGFAACAKWLDRGESMHLGPPYPHFSGS
jgi:hypothetical protein